MSALTVVHNFHPCATLRADIYYSASNPDGNFSRLTNGSAFSSWTDLSGNGNTQTQSTPGNQPSYSLNAINNRPSIGFNAASFDYMSAATSTNNQYAGAITTLIAFRASVSGVSGTQRILTKLLKWPMSILNDNYMFTTWNSGGSGVSANGTTPAIISGVAQANIQAWNGSTSATFYKNSALNETVALSNTTVTTTNPVYLGTRDGTTAFFSGDIADLGAVYRLLNPWETYMTGLYLKIVAGA